MADATQELMMEILRKIQADLADLKRDSRETRVQILGMREQMTSMFGHLQSDILRLDRTHEVFRDSLDRIVKRLELSDGPGFHT